MPATQLTFRLRIESASWEAPNILSYELRPIEGGEIPPFTAGSHIDLTLPNGLVRSYSLVNPQAERSAPALLPSFSEPDR